VKGNLSFFLVSVLLFIASNVCALDAHVHGSVNLDIATDGNELLIMLKTPAESFLGFEYKAKSKSEMALVKKVKNQWKTGLIELIGGKALKDCKITKSSWEQVFNGKNHSSIVAESYIKCQKSVSNRTLQVSLKKEYSHIRKINIQLIRENGSVLNKKFSQAIFQITL